MPGVRQRVCVWRSSILVAKVAEDLFTPVFYSTIPNHAVTER